MTFRSHGLLAAGALGVALCATSAIAADAAPAADYAVVNLNTTVDAPVDVVWKKIGGFCDIQAWLKAPCMMTSGSGDVGSVRHLAFGKNGVDEVMVAKTAHSYTYTQPNTTILYHGTLEVVADGKGKSKILYNLIWDQAAQTSADAKTKDRETRTKAFTGALANMKAIVEGK
jgi:hypothetical protein